MPIDDPQHFLCRRLTFEDAHIKVFWNWNFMLNKMMVFIFEWKKFCLSYSVFFLWPKPPLLLFSHPNLTLNIWIDLINIFWSCIYKTQYKYVCCSNTNRVYQRWNNGRNWRWLWGAQRIPGPAPTSSSHYKAVLDLLMSKQNYFTVQF